MIKQAIISKVSFKSILTILPVPTLLLLYIRYSRQGVTHGGTSIIQNYKPYPLNRGIIHHIVYLDFPILEKPLDLNNYWIWAMIVTFLIVIITLMNILVNIVSLSSEKE